MDLGLEGLNVAVTGASAGIGKAIAEAFAAEGSNLAICGRKAPDIEVIASDLSSHDGAVFAEAVDVFDLHAFARWIEGASKALGGIDVFIANVTSGSDTLEKAAALDLAAQASQFDIVLPYLRQSKSPSVVYIASIAASIATPGFAQYGATKAAMVHYTKSLSKQLVEEGIRVNSVAPGDILAPGNVWDKVRRAKPEVYEKVLERNPRGSLGTPAEVARAVAFVASPAASLINGANIIVDGGGTDHVQI